MLKMNMETPSGAAGLCHRILNLEQGHAATREASKVFVACLDAEHPVEPKSQLGESELVPLLTNKLTTWADNWRSRAPMPRVATDSDAAMRFIIAQYAPLGLSPGSVLQNVANASNCHEPIAAHAHRAYAWHVGDVSLAQNHSALYRQLLEHTGQYLPRIESPAFSARAGLLPVSWTLPTYRLALSLFPGSCTPEILGSALFELHVPVAPLIQTVLSANDALRPHPYMQARFNASRSNAQRHIEMAIDDILARAGENAPAVATRVAQGFWTSMCLLNAWQTEVTCDIQDRLIDPTSRMVNLIHRKALFAVGYHSRLKLADRPFDDCVAADPERFVQDLALSRWIAPGDPNESLLLTRLTAFGGPMFRVFSDPEIETIRAWITSLGANASFSRGKRREQISVNYLARVEASANKVEAAASAEPKVPARDACNVDPKSIGARELYHRLLNHEDFPDVFGDACAFAETWLSRASALSRRGPNAMPFSAYTREQLRCWFDDKALQQARSYAGPAQTVEKTREQVIDEAVQLCPMIFVDGGWVQRWTNTSHVETNVGMLLWKIFSDEIGNGDTLLNHPNIYRDLMRQMGIDLPDFRTREFAENRLFSDASFQVPAFWLSISQFPRRFLPETLGLNLAMELSGVGGAYRTARDELRHYGFDTLFVDLHNTIDNVSTGHSAMALEAIELHMDNVLSTVSRAAVDAIWRRVWTGFCALAMPRRGWRELLSRPTYDV